MIEYLNKIIGCMSDSISFKYVYFKDNEGHGPSQ